MSLCPMFFQHMVIYALVNPFRGVINIFKTLLKHNQRYNIYQEKQVLSSKLSGKVRL